MAAHQSSHGEEPSRGCDASGGAQSLRGTASSRDEGAASGKIASGAGASGTDAGGSDPFGVFGPVPAVSDPGAAGMLSRVLGAPMGVERLRLLAQVDGRLLDASGRVDLMVAWQQCAAWTQAHSELSVALVAGAPPDETGKHEPSSKPTGNIAEDDRCATVGVALRSTPYSAKNRMEAARSAAHEHAPVAERMLAGQWTGLHLWHARSATIGHPTGLARVAVANVCRTPGCELWTPGRLARRIRAELVRLDSEAIAKRIRRRRHQRSAHLDPTDDLHGVITVDAAWETVVWAFGVFRRWAEHERDRLRAIRKQDPAARFCCPQAMARLLTHSNHSHTTSSSGSDCDVTLDGDAGHGDGADAVADPFAGVGPDDDCPFCGQPDAGVPDLAALTADAVIAAAGLLAGTIGDPATTDHAGSKVGKRWGTAIVVVDLPTAFGLADNPGHVPGYGDVPAGIARELLHHAQVWRRFLVDDSGVLTDTGAGTYRPSEKLRDYIKMRDWTCTFPGCARPATQADLDHIINFNGTNTTAANLHVLCRTHHRIKTYAGWTPERQPDGTTMWTSPDGHTYTNTNDTPWTRHTSPHSRTSKTSDTHPDTGPNFGQQPSTDGSCPPAWFDAQTLHTDHITITYPGGEGDDTADGKEPADPDSGPSGGTAGGAGAAPDPRRGSDEGTASRASASTDGGTDRKPWLDGNAEPPPPPDGDTGNPHITTHWPTAPYTSAEHALHDLITAHRTPPTRAP